MSLGASEEMDVVLHQSKDLIWGAAMSEKPEPMGGILSGSISGDRVEIKALYVDGDVLTFTGMEGTFAGETIRGIYFQINSLGDSVRGSFVGMRTSKDPREFAPSSAAQSATEATSETSQISGTEAGAEAEVVEEETGGFTDVHQLSAGINPRILGYAAPVTGKVGSFDDHWRCHQPRGRRLPSIFVSGCFASVLFDSFLRYNSTKGTL